MVDVAADGLFQLGSRAMDATPKLFFSECCEPAFDQVEPTGGGRREVQMEAGPLGQPCADQFGLVGSVVVQNQMHVQLRRHVLLDGIEEGAKLGGAVAAVGL